MKMKSYETILSGKGEQYCLSIEDRGSGQPSREGYFRGCNTVTLNNKYTCDITCALAYGLAGILSALYIYYHAEPPQEPIR